MAVDVFRAVLEYVEGRGRFSSNSVDREYFSQWRDRAPADTDFDEFITYHAWLVIEGGFAEGSRSTLNRGQGHLAHIDNLTNAGHDFIESARRPGIWRQGIAKVGGSAPEVVAAVMRDLVVKAVTGG
ncbi:DUF2513 domain-containing protein [bacterium]|nr:DUF2513 domain-containing protein [bacterium]